MTENRNKGQWLAKAIASKVSGWNPTIGHVHREHLITVEKTKMKKKMPRMAHFCQNLPIKVVEELQSRSKKGPKLMKIRGRRIGEEKVKVKRNSFFISQHKRLEFRLLPTQHQRWEGANMNKQMCRLIKILDGTERELQV